MKTKTIEKQSVFPCGIDRVYALLQSFSTLRYVAAPYAAFEIQNESGDILWRPGQTVTCRLRLFGVIPCGTHIIRVIAFSKKEIYTKENNRHIAVWNHRIRLTDNRDGTTTYRDEIEIGAGWKTVFVSIWAKRFCAHRQKKWIKLLKNQ